ncbi:MAG: hypothetical protein JWL82_7 [Parcubacteria group bacterium]|nr:hypothetical protein [Parcubacteria group bacterium]
MKAGATFSEKVHAAASKIPLGKVATYGQLAALAGNPRAGRAVGMLMSKNRDANVVPCHRVVSSAGALTGYSMGKGVVTKMSKLKKEGVVFKGEKVDLAASLWKGN